MAKLPAHAERIEALAASLSQRMGAPSAWCFTIAEGAVLLLMRHCWRKHSDILHSAEEIDDAAGWSNPPCVLARLMVEAGFLQETQGEYVMAAAFKEAPEYVRKRWRRVALESYRAASARKLPPAAAPERSEPEQQQESVDALDAPDASTATNLFGEPEPDEQPKPKRQRTASDAETTPGHKRVTEYWFRAYEQKYGRRPVFKRRDGKHVRDLLQQCSADELEQAIDNYLACNEPFFAGHDLGKFTGHINRWLVAKGSDGGGGVRYGRADDALPEP